MVFKNRKVAAGLLAEKLKHVPLHNAIVLAVPRGGVPIGYEIDKTLDIPLEIFLSKKIGHPSNPEYAVGSVTLSGWTISREHANISENYIRDQVEKIQPRLAEQYRKYMGDRVQENVSARTVILVDDGVATGHTLISAVGAIRQQNPARIIVAVPVSSESAYTRLKQVADVVICLLIPEVFLGVGEFYQDFSEVTDEEVISLLKKDGSPAY